MTDPYRTPEDPHEMRLRDQFAIAAMQAMLTRYGCSTPEEKNNMAEHAYLYADAMMKARQK